MDGLQGGTKADENTAQQQREPQGSEYQTTQTEQVADTEGSILGSEHVI